MLRALISCLPILAVLYGLLFSQDKLRAQWVKVVNTPRVISTQSEANDLMRAVQVHIAAGDRPKPEEFNEFCRRTLSVKDVKRDAALDAWSTPFGLVYDEANKRVYVLSAGPDRAYNTQDDIYSSAKLNNF